MSKTISLKKMAIAFCLLLSVNLALAQTQNPLWSLPPNYGKNTAGWNLISLPNGAASNQYPNFDSYGLSSSIAAFANTQMEYQDINEGAHNMVADANGNPLFFVAEGVLI